MKTTILVILIFFSLGLYAQQKVMTVQEAIDFALKNNAGAQAASYEVESQKQLRKTGFDLPKTDVILQYGKTNSYAKDNNLIVTQTIPFAALGSQASLNRSLLTSSELRKVVTENELTYQVKQVYYQLAYALAHHDLLLQQDSIYEGFLKSSSSRYKMGEGTLLEQTTAEAQRNEVKNSIHQNQADILSLKTQLKGLLNSAYYPEIQAGLLPELKFDDSPDSSLFLSNPSLAYTRQQIEVAKSQKKVESSKFAPDLLVGFFTQTLIGTENLETGIRSTKSDRFAGIEVGLSIPIWFLPHQSRVKSAEFNRQAAEKTYLNNQIVLGSQMQQAILQHTKHKNSLTYYQTSALPNADLILKQSQAAFKGGDISYTEHLIGIRNVIAIREGYLRTLNDYNQSIIYIEFLTGNN